VHALKLTSVSKAGVPARRPKETKVSLTKGFDLCSTFCFLEARRWLNFALWAALRAAQRAKNRSAHGTIFRTGRVHVKLIHPHAMTIVWPMNNGQESSNPVDLNDFTTSCLGAAILRDPPEELAERYHLQFQPGFDEFDSLVFTTVLLPDAGGVTLLRYTHSPLQGTEVCLRGDNALISRALNALAQALAIAPEDWFWIHPDYVADVR
jgi:hypothetical protein